MKKGLLKILIFFLFVMGFFTVVSKISDATTIARVKTTKVKSMTLEYDFVFVAGVVGKQSSVISIPEGIVIETMYVAPGSIIKNNDKLLSINKDSLDNKIDSLNKEYEKLNGVYSSEVQEHNDQISKATEELNYAEKILNQERANRESQLIGAEKEIENVKKNDEDASAVEKSYLEVQTQTQNSIINAEKEVLIAKQELNSLKAKNITTNLVDMEQVETKLTNYQSIVNNGYNVYSNKNGSIMKINATLGAETTTSDSIILSDDKEGVKAVGNVPSEEKERYSVGQKVIIKNNETNQTLKNQQEISKIYRNSDSDIDEYIIEVDLIETSEINLNSNVEVKAIKNSPSYKNCLPSSAIKMNEKGDKYIQYVAKKKSVMGNIEIVKNLNVEVIENNGKFVAISEKEAFDNLSIVYECNRELYAEDRVFVENDIENE